jgi:hypothetical protein
MAFKKREYNFYKKLCKETISHIPNHEIYGCKPIFPPSILLALLPDYIERQNFEACKAVVDTIREWCAEYGIDVPPDTTLIIPPKRDIAVHGHLSLGDPDDPTGIGSGDM